LALISIKLAAVTPKAFIVIRGETNVVKAQARPSSREPHNPVSYIAFRCNADGLDRQAAPVLDIKKVRNQKPDIMTKPSPELIAQNPKTKLDGIYTPGARTGD